MFGKFVKEIRLSHELGLREFCVENEYDPSNWSKVERELIPPPKDEETLSRWARSLKIKEGSAEWKKFFDFASVDSGLIPKYILEDGQLLERLPVFFRTLEGKKPSSEDLEKLLGILRKA